MASEARIGNWSATAGAIVVSWVVFFTIWFIGGVLFNIFDSLRGLSGDKLQAVFRELFVPGVAGYFSQTLVYGWFQKASIKMMFFGFSSFILVTVGVYLGFVVPVATKIGVDILGLLLSIASIVAAIIGAYIADKDALRAL
ncbi:MAG: hypothetical protein AB7C98_11930 [Acidithiobacillus sp.]